MLHTMLCPIFAATLAGEHCECERLLLSQWPELENLRSIVFKTRFYIGANGWTGLRHCFLNAMWL